MNSSPNLDEHITRRCESLMCVSVLSGGVVCSAGGRSTLKTPCQTWIPLKTAISCNVIIACYSCPLPQWIHNKRLPKSMNFHKLFTSNLSASNFPLICRIIGILVLNKGTSNFTYNTVLIPKQDQLMFKFLTDLYPPVFSTVPTSLLPWGHRPRDRNKD